MGQETAWSWHSYGPLHSLRDIVDNAASQVHRLCLRSTKDAIKWHVELNHLGYLPKFVSITGGELPQRVSVSGCWLRIP